MSDGTAVPFAKKPTVMPVMYRAVIFGEEHIVKGWNGENLLTDKGEFVFGRLKGKRVDSEWAGVFPGGVPNKHPIQSTTLLEVATLLSDGNGGWLLNGHNLSPLEHLPAGCRLNDITSSEVLRVYKGEIRAVAWVQAISGGSITLQLDTVLADWKAARKFGQANVKSVIPDNFYLNQFAGWSKPIWLTEFHQVGAAKETWLTGISKVLDPQPESVSVPDIMEKGINPFLHGLKNVPAQPASRKPEEVAKDTANHLKSAADDATNQIRTVVSELRASTKQLAEVAQPFREMYKDQRLAGAKADALKAGIPELVVDVIVRFYHTSKMPTTDGLVKHLNSSGDSTKLESTGQGTSRATIGRWLSDFKKIMRHRGLMQAARVRHTNANQNPTANSEADDDQTGPTFTDTRTQELPEGTEPTEN